jgi:hypothetical protein
MPARKPPKTPLMEEAVIASLREGHREFLRSLLKIQSEPEFERLRESLSN